MPGQLRSMTRVNERDRPWISWTDLARHGILVFLLFFTFFPFLFEIVTSFKDESQFQHSYWLPSFPLSIGNYLVAWAAIRMYILNSIRITALSVAGALLVASLSAYVFARYRFPGRDILFFLVLGLLMIPGILTFIPRFIILKNLGLFNTIWALILPYIAFGQPFAIFVLRSFFASIPEELIEAARIDGASDVEVFTKIVLPLSYAPIAAVGLVEVLDVYNDYLWPLIIISDENLKTAAIGVVRFSGVYVTQYGPLMAGYLLMSLPLILLFMIAMRYFVEGIASGALKL